jgi:hypothetical protein
MPIERSPAEYLAAQMDATKNEIRKVAVGTVTGVYPDRQTVDVQLAVNNPIFDEIGNVYSEAAPSISDIPLGVMRGGGMFVWMPVAVGDSVLVLFTDLSTDTWRDSQTTQSVDPGFVGKHTMDSAFAIPCCAPDASFFADPNNDPAKIIIGKDGSAAQIRISPTDIELGNAVTDAVALASLVNTELGKISTALSSLVAPSGGGPVTGNTYTSPVNVASTLVKAQ